MRHQKVLQSKKFAANGARIRFLSRVDQLVAIPTGFDREGFAAVRADVRFQPRVDPEMFDQVSFLSKTLAAF